MIREICESKSIGLPFDIVLIFKGTEEGKVFAWDSSIYDGESCGLTESAIATFCVLLRFSSLDSSDWLLKEEPKSMKSWRGG